MKIYKIFYSLAACSGLYALDPYCVQAVSFEQSAVDANLTNTLKELVAQNKEARLEKIGEMYTLRIGYYKGYSEAQKVLQSVQKIIPNAYIRHCIYNPAVRIELESIMPLVAKEQEEKPAKDEKAPTPAPVTAAAITDTLALSLNQKNKKEEAIELYKKEKYGEAQSLLQNLLKVQTNDPQIWFYLGRCQFEMKDFKAAAQSFGRVLQIDPKHPLSKLELAESYYFDKQYDKAKGIFDGVLLQEYPTSVKENVGKFLEMISLQKNTQKLKEEAIINKAVWGISVGGGYDSNVNTASNVENYYIPLYNINATNDTNKQSDYYTQNILYFSYKVPLADGYFYENRELLYAQNYAKYNEKNSYLFSVNNSFGRRTGMFSYQIPLTLSRFWYGQNVFLDNVALNAKADYAFAKNVNVALGVGYKRNVYRIEQDKEKNSGVLEYKAELNYGFSAEDFVQLASLYEHEQKSTANLRTDVDNNALTMKLTYTKFIDRYIFNGSVSLRTTDYKDTDALLLSKRKDKNLNLTLAVSKKVFEDMLLTLSGSLIQNDSNHKPFEYTKQIFGASLAKEF